MIKSIIMNGQSLVRSQRQAILGSQLFVQQQNLLVRAVRRRGALKRFVNGLDTVQSIPLPKNKIKIGRGGEGKEKNKKDEKSKSKNNKIKNNKNKN